jgi:polysaccharide biosynthesis protein PslH
MKILVLLSRFPYPLEKGDKLRAFQHLQHMKSSGHEVHLIALSDQKVSADAISKIAPYCSNIEVIPISVTGLLINLTSSFIRKLPLQVGYFYSLFTKRRIRKAIMHFKPDVVYCQLIRMAAYVKDIKDVPLVIDYQDAFSKGTFQRMEKSPAYYKSIFEREFNLVKKFETDSYDWFDSHIIISEQDRKALNIPEEKEIHIIPNGIDIDYFKPTGDVKAFDVSFIGNMNYPPNVDAALFLVNEIMPIVWKDLPDVKVQIAGANPTKKVRSLSSLKVTVTGWVNDIRNSYSRSRIFIAPMRTGTGLQNKLLEAMAMTIPCIATSLSFMPLSATANHDILVGDTADELANQIIRLLKDRDFAELIARNGYYFVLSKYSMEHSRIQLEAVLNNAVKKKQTA